MPAVGVALATFDGEAHLRELLDSVLGQSLDVRVVARDDGSSDGTRNILADYAGRIRVQDADGNLGVIGNFNRITASLDTPYIAFADQDDIWEKNKLEALLQKMQSLEAEYGEQTPILVHSDLAVCDARGKVTAGSLWRFQHLDPEVKALPRLLVQNNVTGCASLINRALAERAFPVPPQAVMHDWWLALTAAAFGRIGHVPGPLVRYRQHGKNQLGAVASGPLGVLRRLRCTDPGRSLAAARRQARAFEDRFGHGLGVKDSAAARAYAHIGSRRYPARVGTLVRHGLWKQDFFRNLGLVVFI